MMTMRRRISLFLYIYCEDDGERENVPAKHIHEAYPAGFRNTLWLWLFLHFFFYAGILNEYKGGIFFF